MHCVRRLRKAAVDVTLVDRGTSHVFQPLLYQCATGLLSEGAISSPIRHLTRRQRNLDVVLGEAAGIDVETREIIVDRLDRSSFRLPYDYLSSEPVCVPRIEATISREICTGDEVARRRADDPPQDHGRLRDGGDDHRPPRNSDPG